MINALKSDLKKLGDPKKAEFFPGFFKTGVGQYGEGDKFLGVSVPNQRKTASKYLELTLKDLSKLLYSKIHEERLTSLIILTEQFKKADPKLKKKIFDFYIKNAKFVNNWDLVDCSADKIVGEFLINSDKSILLKLAKSENLWEKRISIVATYAFIKKGHDEWTYKIAQILLTDKHDLIQKAVGWMLRECGKRVTEKNLLGFLNANYQKMPRTMLRYAIERLPQDLRLAYLHGKI